MRNIAIQLSAIALMLSSSCAILAEPSEAPAVTFSTIITANSGGAQEAMVVGGGRWLTQRKLVHTAILVSHPKGDFLWDSGIGRDYEAQMEAFSFWQKPLFKIENVKPAAAQLKSNSYDTKQLMAIIPSHMHWDHASALEDFPNTPVWLQKQEHLSAQQGKPPGFIHSQFDSEALVWKYIQLNESPYEGFEKSLDLFSDGSVILVDLSGHTSGQLGMFLNTPKGRYFFIGDTTWSIEGVKTNRGRPSFVNWMMGVDQNAEQNDQVIEKIHALSQSNPELIVVPAHDENIANKLPLYPNFL